MILSNSAYLFSQSSYPYYAPKAGLYPLERLIKFLISKGVKNFILDLSSEEDLFWGKKLHKYFRKNKDISFWKGSDKLKQIEGSYFSLPSNIFLQPKHFNKLEDFFEEEGLKIIPIKEKFFYVNNFSDLDKIELLLQEQIKEGTSGFLAREVNKRISLPISVGLAATRIHPNFLTAINMLVGLGASMFLWQAAVGGWRGYIWQVMAGLFFQLASIFDGVDGEVAKLTLKVSKFGGWLDTASDNLTLFLFLLGSSYLNFIGMNKIISLLFVMAMFLGLFLMLFYMFSYLKEYSESGSLVAYDKEFLDKLPKDDFIIKIINRFKYFTKKEFFSTFFLLLCLLGKIAYLIPIVSLVVLAGAFLLMLVHKIYLKDFVSNLKEKS